MGTLEAQSKACRKSLRSRRVTGERRASLLQKGKESELLNWHRAESADHCCGYLLKQAEDLLAAHAKPSDSLEK